jgi:outer membrane protein OmpA-like peptidoglycan-associated protein
MSFPTIALFSALVLAAGVATAQKAPLKDLPGFKDPALFTRMPGYFLYYSGSLRESQFDAYEFLVQRGAKAEKQQIEGHKIVYYYTFDTSAGQVPPSPLQIKRNYQNATLKVGGKVLYEEGLHSSYNTTTFLVAKDGRETWAEFKSGDGRAYYLTIVEREAMHQDVVANAEALKSGLAESGHAEIQGIFFDFNKSEIKPESQPALQEVAKLLQGSPALRVWIVGHTDNVGTAEFNVTLSNARAAAVVKALVAAGIDARRLTPHGDGPFAPVATNATEEGRARNRRVELVAQP